MANWKTRSRRRIEYVKGTKRLKKAKRIAALSKLALAGVVFLFIGLLVVFPLFAINLPSPDKVVRREGYSTKILDRNGTPLYDIYENERRTPVDFEEIPIYLRQATIAIEDKNFYSHQGFDPLGMLRGLSRIVTRGFAQGGSTLTQQLVKNVLLSSERTIFRKIREFILAVQIEKRYTKDEILQMYLNEAPYGGTAYGVESASEMYFGKNVKDLNLIESVVVAGIPQRPSVYSPFSSTPKAYIDRSEDVLRRMEEDGYITKEQEENARAALPDIEFQEKGSSFKAPHFVQYVQKILEERYGENVVETGGLTVTTTLDLELQDDAQEVVSGEIAKVEELHITNGAAVVLKPQTGEILAMVGSKNFNDPDYDGQVNVTTSLRQPGSAIKPVTYATAFKEGYTASTLIMDLPTEFPGGAGNPIYKPENYDGKYRGPIQLRFALANSINVPAVKVLALVGIRDMLNTAYDLGITSLEPTKQLLSRVGLSLTLGGGEVRLLELTGAYCAFANEGYRVNPTSILKVEDSNGKVLEKNDPKKVKQVLSEGEAFIMYDILSDNNARSDVFGPNSLLNIPNKKIAVKTGTTNDKRDNWTVGGNGEVMVGVWVGNNDNTPMIKVASGISGASPIWRNIILKALSKVPSWDIEIPSSVTVTPVDIVSGYRAHDGFPERNEYFVSGSEPGEDTVHVKLKLCKNDGNLANPADINSGNYDEKEFFLFKEEDPFEKEMRENKWQRAVLEWMFQQSDERYHPPTEYCGATNPISVGFNEPSDKQSNLDNNFKTRMRADSVSDITLLELFLDGEKIRGYTSPPYEYEFELDDGVYELKVKAKDSDGNQNENTIKIGVGVEWDYDPEPTPDPET